MDIISTAGGISFCVSGEEREGINELQWTCTTGSETTSLGIIQYLFLCVTSECVRVVCLCAHVASDLRVCAAASSKRKSVTLLLGYNSALATESIYQETESGRRRLRLLGRESTHTQSALDLCARGRRTYGIRQPTPASASHGGGVVLYWQAVQAAL